MGTKVWSFLTAIPGIELAASHRDDKDLETAKHIPIALKQQLGLE